MIRDRFTASSTARAVAVWSFCVLFLPCCASLGGGKTVQGPAACFLLDSLYQRSGFESTVVMAGKAVFDVEQYRVRGKFHLVAGFGGEVGFEFSSSSLFGSSREEFSISVSDGVMRILDRERGRYYEGEEVDVLLRDNLEVNICAKDIVSLVLGDMPMCENLEGSKLRTSGDGEISFFGRTLDRPASIVFGADTARLKALRWPIRFKGESVDWLRVEYSWFPDREGNSNLKGLVLSVEERGWRIKLRAES